MFLRTHPALVARASVAATVLLGAAFCAADGPSEGRRQVPQVIVLNDNGAWSWFEDERAVVDPVTGTLVVSSVADASGTGGMTRDGNVEVAVHDIAAGTTRREVLHAHLEDDDHNSAALYLRRDGRYVAMYSTHAADTRTRWRVSDPADRAGWSPERALDHGSAVTYSNVYPARDGRLYAFVRTAGLDPHVLVSDDEGVTWRAGGQLLNGPGRPYVRYAADHTGRIHILATEQHPHAAPTSVYHGIIDEGRLLRSDGTVVDPDLSDDVAARTERLTSVFAASGGERAWTVDLQVDAHGWPHAVFSVHGREAGNDYWYSWFDGAAWRTHFLAPAGSALYRGQPFYTGLVAIDPGDVGRVVISTDVHPETGVPLISGADGQQHHELFEGITTDGGATWHWTTITADSTAHNLRPIIPIWDSDQRALLWLRGVYTKYTEYDLDVVAIIANRRRPITASADVAATVAAAGAAHPVAASEPAVRRRWRRRC